jgi:hypothetical protein
MKRDRLSEKMEKVLTPSYKFRRICCAWVSHYFSKSLCLLKVIGDLVRV